MAKGSNAIHHDVFNEVDGKDPNKADSNGMDLYFGGYKAIIEMHGSESGDMVESPNAKASRDLYGGTAKGEPAPVEMGGKPGK